MDKRAILWLILGVIDIVLIALYIVPVFKHREKEKAEAKLEQEELRAEERHILEMEYNEACQDWRQRDKYVLDKLSTSGLLFGLIGIAFGTIGEGHEIIKVCLLFIGILFSFMLAMSVAKDTYYRDGSERLVRSLASRLGIVSSLQGLKCLVDELDEKGNLKFPRKISIKRDESSIMVWVWLRDRLLNRATFNWILAFYLGSCLIFINLLILILMDWQGGLDLPI